MSDIQIAISIFIVSIFAWFSFRIYKKNKIDRLFKCKVSGGRDGHILIEIDGVTAKYYYDLGSEVDFILFESSLERVDGKPLDLKAKDKVKSTLLAWAHARGSRISLIP